MLKPVSYVNKLLSNQICLYKNIMIAKSIALTERIKFETFNLKRDWLLGYGQICRQNRYAEAVSRIRAE